MRAGVVHSSGLCIRRLLAGAPLRFSLSSAPHTTNRLSIRRQWWVLLGKKQNKKLLPPAETVREA